MKQKLMVVCGGQSSEHIVSRMSCTSVMNNLNKEHYDVSNGTSSWPFWCDLYCGDAVFIQFFDVSGHPFLCEMQCCISFRR